MHITHSPVYWCVIIRCIIAISRSSSSLYVLKITLRYTTTVFRMPVTEIACVGVKPGFDIMDESTGEGKVLIAAWNTVAAAPGGPHRVYWGLQVEDPSKLWAFFDWDSVEDHEKFIQS